MFAILNAIDGHALDAEGVLSQLSDCFELETEEDPPLEVLEARLAELASLGLANAVE